MKLFTSRKTPTTDNPQDRLDAAWQRYHAAFAALHASYNAPLAERERLSEVCKAATDEIQAARHAIAGRSMFGGQS